LSSAARNALARSSCRDPPGSFPARLVFPRAALVALLSCLPCCVCVGSGAVYAVCPKVPALHRLLHRRRRRSFLHGRSGRHGCGSFMAGQNDAGRNAKSAYHPHDFPLACRQQHRHAGKDAGEFFGYSAKARAPLPCNRRGKVSRTEGCCHRVTSIACGSVELTTASGVYPTVQFQNSRP